MGEHTNTHSQTINFKTHFMEELIPIVFFIATTLMIVGIVYFRSRENLAMIEKGLNPKDKQARPAPFISLKFGLLLIGLGSGLFLAYLLDELVLRNSHGEPIYFALLGIGGGLGLLGSYKTELAWMEKNQVSEKES